MVTGILLVLGAALAAAVIGMLISGTASEITLAATPKEEMADQHH